MISDEGQQRAAYAMREAAETHLRAAQTFAEAVQQLAVLVGSGYGNPLEVLTEELRSVRSCLADPGDDFAPARQVLDALRRRAKGE